MTEFSDEAIAYFDAHLADDPVTVHMLSRLDLVADELEKAKLADAVGAARFARALELGDAKSSAELPFELDETTCEILDGAQSRGAMEAHCTSAQARHAAAVVNTIRRISDGKSSYAWADEVLRESPLKTYAQVSLSVIDDDLARLALALNHELRLLTRLDTLQAVDADQEYQAVVATALVLFWAEDGQIHCGMRGSYGGRWAEVVGFARDRGYPIHDGFQGELLDEDTLASVP